MASSLFAEDLTCSVCLSLFSDPVTLRCGHAFCRRCAAEALAVQPRCPQCSLAVVVTEARGLASAFILKSLAEKARGAQSQEAPGVQEVDLCAEHEEKLKLFCFTDQQLACIICRDSDRHEGHKFKPIKEADAVLRKELENFVQKVSSDISEVETLAHKQKEEIVKSKEKAEHLTTQISSQFKKMHEFLQRREKEIKHELKQKQEDDMRRLSENLSIMEGALSESRELQVKANLSLSITNPEKFLKTWTEGNNKKNSEVLLRPRANELRVENTSFSLGPHENLLQFIVWKEMLEVIQPRPERLLLTNNSPEVIITNSGRSLIWNKATNSSVSPNTRYTNNAGFGIAQQVYHKNSLHDFGWANSPSYSAPIIEGQAFSSSEFSSGEHYWEVDVGTRNIWKLGIRDHFLHLNNQIYTVHGPNITRAVKLENMPQRIGLHLNCSSKQLAFYDAERLTRIDTVDLNLRSFPVSAYFSIQHRDPEYDPITVCWY